jgi:anti-anti-sigma factor
MDMTVADAADGVTQVTFDGRFDIAGSQAVDARFQELAQTAETLIVDLSRVTFIASLGVRTLMVGAKTIIRRGADMAVCGADDNVSRVLRSTGFNEVAGLYDDLSAAAAALKERHAGCEGKKT